MKIVEAKKSEFYVFSKEELKELKVKFKKINIVLADKDGLYSVQNNGEKMQLSVFADILMKLSKYIGDNFSLFPWVFLQGDTILFGFKEKLKSY
mgnify:CR=1 FL=1